MSQEVVLLPGDGIGPEVVHSAVRVLSEVSDSIVYDEHLFGGASIDKCGVPLTDETLLACQKSDAVLLGAAGGLQWSNPDSPRPERGLLSLRKELVPDGLYANLRPIHSYPALYRNSPLKQRVLKDVDLLFVRELSSGIYNGESSYIEDEASDICRYTRAQIERIAHVAFRFARTKVTSVDKANVMATSKLWRKVVSEVAEGYDVETEHLLVDNAAAQLMMRPKEFDVILTENLFGDILSDESAVIPGSLGMMPSASLAGEGLPGLFEPGHGSAPEIAGQGIANPYATILSGAMMLRHFNMSQEAVAIELAVQKAVNDTNFHTQDLGGRASTEQVTNGVLSYI